MLYIRVIFELKFLETKKKKISCRIFSRNIEEIGDGNHVNLRHWIMFYGVG